MKAESVLNYIHKTGLFGNHENKNEENLLKVSEIKNLLIVQIVQYKNSSILLENLDIDSLKLKNEPFTVVSNKDTRILWNGPKNWLLISTKKDLLKNIIETFKEIDFAVTDLSHSRSIIEIEERDGDENALIGWGPDVISNTFHKNGKIDCIHESSGGGALSYCFDENGEKLFSYDYDHENTTFILSKDIFLEILSGSQIPKSFSQLKIIPEKIVSLPRNHALYAFSDSHML